MFNRLGSCSTGWTAKKLKTDDDSLAYPVKFMLRMASLAGLLHDIGKSNVAFQNLLRAISGAETFRHEAVSAMMLAWLADPENDTDVKWIQSFIAAAEDGSMHKRITESLKKQALLRESELKPALAQVVTEDEWGTSDSALTQEPYSDFEGCSTNDSSKRPVLFGLLWLITSHHRLPDGSNSNGKASLNTKVHSRKFDSQSVKEVTKHGLPWNEPSWVKRLVADLQSLQSLVKDGAFESYKPSYYDHLRLFARPAFQLADHLISSDKHPDPQQKDGAAFANTVDAETKGGQRKLGQKLHSHLIAVSRKARVAVHELLNLRNDMPALLDESVPAMLRKNTQEAAYEWQNAAVKAVRANRKALESSAFFGVLIAGLGSGKTITGLKMIAAIPNGMRVIYTSPLRSLTLQAGSMFSEVGFPTDDLAVIIGDPLIQKMYEQTERDKSAEIALTSINEADPESIEVSGGFCSEDLKAKVQSLACLDSRALKMVATPVLSATLDTVIKLADGRRGSYLTHLMRIASSDLIIDEADMYSAQDLIPIGRLIEAAGFWRSKVILSSGTLSPIISNAFFAAYIKGLAARNSLDGKAVEVYGGWFSNVVDPVLKKIPSVAKYIQVNQDFAGLVSAHIVEESRKNPKRRVAGYINRYPNERDKFSVNPQGVDAGKILKYAKALHDRTSVSLGGDRRFSFGCVQVVNVTHCQRIVIDLCNVIQDKVSLKWLESQDIDFRVACLHGRLSMASRNEIEERLNVMLNRKGSGGDLAPLKDKDAADFAKTSTAKNIIIILASTMETTGRDHDFDWGIIESRQERDIIQFSGRIRRHRSALAGDRVENLVLWNTPLRWDGKAWPGGKKSPFEFYGVADKVGKELQQPDFEAKKRSLPDNMVGKQRYGVLPIYSEMMKLTYGDVKPIIDSSRILVDVQMAIGESTTQNGYVAHTVRAAETGKLYGALLDYRFDKHQSLAEWLHESNTVGRLLTKHADAYRFRSGRKMEYYWRDETNKWFHVSAPGKEYIRSISKPQGELGDVGFDTNRLLLSFDEDQAISEIMNATQAHGFMARLRLSGVNVNKQSLDWVSLGYHAQLGVIDPIIYRI
jgi:CRISPR-associated endonuclease/helicase Cas3